MTEKEDYLDAPGGRVWYRAIGERTGSAAPLLCLHGGPGFAHKLPGAARGAGRPTAGYLLRSAGLRQGRPAR
jgi:hypothetical protein